MLRLFFAIGVLGMLGSCQPAPDAPYINPLWTPEHRECVSNGGDWAQGGLLGLYQCFPHYSDAGQACSASSQCEGLCMADTKQCAASFEFGCYGYLDDQGARLDICVD